MDPDQADLKMRVNKMIDFVLKEEIVLESQRVELKYGEKEQKVLVNFLCGIAKSWKTDGSIKNAE